MQWHLRNNITSFNHLTIIYTCIILGHGNFNSLSEYGRVISLIYSFCGISIGFLTINELSRLLVFLTQLASFLIIQHQESAKGFRVSDICLIISEYDNLLFHKWYMLSNIFLHFCSPTKVPSILEKQLKTLSSNLLRAIQSSNEYIKRTDNKCINDNVAINEERNIGNMIDTSIPVTTSALLFSVFFVLTSIFYCIIFLWKNPLDGLFLTGMLFTTTGSADTIPKVKKGIFIFIQYIYGHVIFCN